MRQLKITKSITNRESESLEKYLQGDRESGPGDRRRGGSPGQRIKQGDQEALEKLVKANLRFSIGGQTVPAQRTDPERPDQ